MFSKYTHSKLLNSEVIIYDGQSLVTKLIVAQVYNLT